MSVSNRNLASAAATVRTDPRESFSKVALRARAFLDAAYLRLKKVADSQTTEKEWREDIEIGKLDRRALYAIQTNYGGLFSNVEIGAAGLPVADMLKKATAAADPWGNDPAAAFKASIGVLDGASSEEKVSLTWIKARAKAQWDYESAMQERHRGRMPANVKTNNPVVDLFAKAWGEFSSKIDGLDRVEDAPSWSKAVSLWNIQNSSRMDSNTVGHL